MNVKLVYQKVYFKHEEWQNVVNFFQELKISSFLLSKNIFLPALKQFKSNVVGDCLIVEYPVCTLSIENIQKLLDFISLVKKQYMNKLYLIGLLLEKQQYYYFLNIHTLESYLAYYEYKKKQNEGYNLNVLLLRELYKMLVCIELNRSVNVMKAVNETVVVLYKYSSYY